MWSIYGSETAVSETAISQLQNRSKYRILHSILQSIFSPVFVPLWGEKCDFLQVFVPRVLIFKKSHLLFAFGAI